MLMHGGHASSTATVSLTVPEPATKVRFDFYGAGGWDAIPADHGISLVVAHRAPIVGHW